MSELMKITIDVTKITKSRLYPGKNGAKYLNAILIATPDSPHGNSHMIVEDTTKEERESGMQGVILGNAKIMGKGAKSAAKPASGAKSEASSQPDDSDSIPF